MTLNNIKFRAIGVIYTPWQSRKNIPVQPIGGIGVKGKIVMESEFIPYLKDVDGFSHLILLYFMHLVNMHNAQVIPFLDNVPRGLFSTRAPNRPNPIGLSIVRLIKIEKNILHIQDLDMVDGTPLLDIKPYIPAVDSVQTENIGWLRNKVKNFQIKRSDARFD
jgi:tRNA-Thr(GGU) m(6)t(6)A37 methyltransferase TsaA